jgi:hypothetical protein
MALIAEIDWNTLLQKSPDLFPLLVMFGVTGLVAMTAVIAVQWRKAQQARYNAYLKQRLIERGFTAEEIVNVVQADVQPQRVGKSARRQAFYKPSTT